MPPDENRTRDERLVRLLNKAKSYLREGNDNKYFISEQDIQDLIQSGVKPLKVNQPAMGGKFLHEFIFGGIHLISATTFEIDEKTGKRL